MEKKRTHRIQIALDDTEKECVDKETDANGFENPQQYARHAMKRFPELNGALLRFNAVVEQKKQLEEQIETLTSELEAIKRAATHNQGAYDTIVKQRDELVKEKNAAVSQLRDVESRLRTVIVEREGHKTNAEVAANNLKQAVDVQEQLKQHATDIHEALARLEKMVTPQKRKWFWQK